MKKLLSFVLILFFILTIIESKAQTGFDFGIDDGANTGVIAIGPVTGLTDWTIEFWFKPDGEVNYQNIISTEGPSGGNTGIRLETSLNWPTGHLYTYDPSGGNVLIDLAGSLNNRWYHIAFVGDQTNSNFKIYLDGVELVDKVVTLWPSSFSNLVLGKGFSLSAERDYNGQIDEFRFWDEARTQAEILENINTALTGNETNLRIYYDFEEGNAGDDNSALTSVQNKASGGGFNGAISELPLTGNEGNYITGKALSSGNTSLGFDGVDDNIQIADNANLQFGTGDFSIEAWIYYDGTAQNSTIVGKRNPANPFEQIQLRIGNGLNSGPGKKVEAYILPDGRTVLGLAESPEDRVATATSDLTIGWHHLVMVQDYDVALSVYVDGVLVASDADDHLGKTVNIVGQDLFIGSYGNGGYFNGSIDEVRIWGHALTQSEILTNINQTLTGSESGLIAYYNFEEGAPNGDNSATGGNITQVLDQAGSYNGSVNNFTRTGSSSNWVNGKAFSSGNTALDFDGVDDYIELASNGLGIFNLPNITIEAWVKVNSPSDDDVIYSYDYTTHAPPYYSTHFRIQNGGRLFFGWNINGTYDFILTGFNTIGYGVWNHVAAVFTNGRQEIWLNGNLVGSKNSSGSITYYNQNVTIGKGAYANSEFNGQIDEVRIWNTALSQADMQNRMTSPLTGNETGLVAYYPFEEGVGNEDNTGLSAILDKAGGNTGTLNGFAQTGSTSNWVSETSIITTSANTNTALDFDGANDNIGFTNSVSAPLRSISLWIKTSSNAATPVCSGIYISRLTTDGKVHAYFNGSSSSGTVASNNSTTVVTDGNWHHIAATNDGSTTRLYIDGVLEVTYADAYTQFSPEQIGGISGAYFDGQVDEYASWNKVLSQQEIVTYMSQKLTGSETGLALYYDFEEGVPNGDNSASGGNITHVIDQAGSNNGSVNNFTRNGSSSNWVSGKAFSEGNTAMDFDGVDDYVDIGFGFAEQVFSIEMMVNPGNTQLIYADIMDNNHTGFQNWVIQQDASNLNQYYFAVFNGSVTTQVNFSLTANQWQHLALVKSNTSLDCYINGVLVNSTPWSGTINYVSPFLRISRFGGGGRFWNGSLDEVRIWNRPLTQAEIYCQMNAPLTGSEPGLVAYYDFEEGVELGNNTNLTTVFDKAGSNDGTLNGFAKTGISSNWVVGTELDQDNTCSPMLSLSGNGQTITNGATPELANHTDFGKLAVGGSLVRTFTIINTGSETVTLTGSPLVAISGSTVFSVTTQPASASLVPGSSTTFQVTFTPTGSAIETATVSIASDDPASPFNFEIQGSTNTAMDFDGVNDYIELASNGLGKFDLPSFTIEAWIYADAPTTYHTIYSYDYISHTPPYYACQFRLSPPGEIYLGWNNSGTFQFLFTSANTITYGSWNHVAAVFTNGRQEIWLNGNLVASASNNHTITYYNQEVWIGKGNFNGSSMDGKLDEVRIWNRALCQEEIQGRMNTSLQGNENGLVAYYDFEEGVPAGNNTALTQVKDKAGTNNGTLNNFDLGATAPGTSGNFVAGTTLTDDGLVTGTAVTWLGGTSDWNTASNWNPAAVPDQCSDVVIPATANDPVFSNNQAVNSIEIQSGATLTVQPGGCFWVGSTFTNNGDFILQANSSNYAQYQGPQVYGTMQQVIDAAGWHTIASPFIDAILADITFDQNAFLQFGAQSQCNIQFYDGGEHQANPPGTYNNAWGSWLCAADENALFDGSQAYNLYLDDVFFADAFPVTMTVSGTLRNMPITHQLNGANGGWNNLSNPFPSVIDWEKWSDNSDVSSTYYIWDASANGGAGDYYTYMVGGISVPPNTLTQYIAPYQSVFVRTSNGQNTNSGDEPDVFQDHLTSNADRPTSCPASVNAFYKTQLTGELHIKTQTADGVYSDAFAIRFGPGFNQGFVRNEEAEKFFSPTQEDPDTYVLIDGLPYVISSFPEPQAEVQHIPLGMQTETGQEISISATEIPEGIIVYLEDKEAGLYHNLATPYRFRAIASVDNTRFKLHIGDENLGPNELGADDDYLVYQNQDELIFVYNEKLFGGQAQLLNVSGQILARAEVCEGCTMNVSDLPIGLYIMMVEANGKIYSQKVFVK